MKAFTHNVKTDTNLFIDIRLYSDTSIILFYLFLFGSDSRCSTNSLPDSGIFETSLSFWWSVPPFHKLSDSWYLAPSFSRTVFQHLCWSWNNILLLTARVCLVIRLCYLLNIRYHTYLYLSTCFFNFYSHFFIYLYALYFFIFHQTIQTIPLLKSRIIFLCLLPFEEYRRLCPW